MATAGSGDVLSGIIANAVLSTPEYSYTYTDEEKKCANQAQLENVAREEYYFTHLQEKLQET